MPNITTSQIKPKREVHKTLITNAKSDKDYLTKTIYDLSRLEEKTNQSELYALGLSLLRNRSPKDLQKLLHHERERTR